MTWLSKIEHHDHEVREQYPEMGSDEFESERMARVLRELARVAVQAQPHRYSYEAADLHDALSALSDDAKELVNE